MNIGIECVQLSLFHPFPVINLSEKRNDKIPFMPFFSKKGILCKNIFECKQASIYNHNKLLQYNCDYEVRNGFRLSLLMISSAYWVLSGYAMNTNIVFQIICFVY